MTLFTPNERAEYDAEQDAIRAVRKAMSVAKTIGQGSDVSALKEQLEQNLKHSQESYEFLKALRYRVNTLSCSNLEHTEMSYLNTAMAELEKIEGIKK